MKKRIARLCQMEGIPLYKLEQELGFAKGFLSKIESSSPSVKAVVAIADRFGCSLDWLVGRCELRKEK